MTVRTTRRRCTWAGTSDPLYLEYHDREWGRPVRDDRVLFESLILEGAQAGLSWITILRKRDAYRRALHRFDHAKLARCGARDVARWMRNAGLVRNRAKLESVIGNARAFAAVRAEFGSFADYLWAFVDGRPLVNARRTPHAARSARVHAAVGPDREGPQAPRVQVRRHDDRLCLPAGGRRGR